LWSGSDGVLWFYFNLDLLIWIWFYTAVVFATVSSTLSVDWWLPLSRRFRYISLVLVGLYLFPSLGSDLARNGHFTCCASVSACCRLLVSVTVLAVRFSRRASRDIFEFFQDCL
jgi:hypothetical protein